MQCPNCGSLNIRCYAGPAVTCPDCNYTHTFTHDEMFVDPISSASDDRLITEMVSRGYTVA